jgi:hypothetical protein
MDDTHPELTYEWSDNDGVKHVTAWSKAVRNAMLRGGAEFQRQKALNRPANNWNRAFLRSTDIGLHRIGQVTSTGAQSDLMDSTRCGWRCMLQLQEADNWKNPAATTWAAEFLLGRAKACGKWLHMIGTRASPGCELCKRARNMDLKTTDVLPTEKVAHIQSAGCKAQKKSVIGAHNRCGDKDRQLKQLWTETRIGNILPWDEIADEAERLLESDQANRQAPDDDHVDKEQEDDQVVDRDETDPYNEVIFGRRRPDSVAVDWTSKVLYVLEFKRTSDQKQNYRERRESRVRAQHGVLVKSLEKGGRSSRWREWRMEN